MKIIWVRWVVRFRHYQFCQKKRFLIAPALTGSNSLKKIRIFENFYWSGGRSRFCGYAVILRLNRSVRTGTGTECGSVLDPYNRNRNNRGSGSVLRFCGSGSPCLSRTDNRKLSDLCLSLVCFDNKIVFTLFVHFFFYFLTLNESRHTYIPRNHWRITS